LPSSSDSNNCSITAGRYFFCFSTGRAKSPRLQN
jgi:hypothetical protein